MQTIYLIRHGESLPSQGPEEPDHIRGLTERGRRDIQEQAEFLKPLMKSSAIYYSPFRRSVHSAQILTDIIGARSHVLPHLIPSGTVDRVMGALTDTADNVVLVSHLPLLGDFVRQMTGKMVVFFPGTCAKIERPDSYVHSGEFIWLRHPGQGEALDERQQ